MDDPTPKPTPGGLAQYLNDAVATPHRTSEQVSTALKVWAFDWFLPTIRALRSYQELLDSFAPEAMSVKFTTLDLRDEEGQRAYIEALKTAGVPITDARLAVNIPPEETNE